MNQPLSELYEFGAFRLDPREHLLLKDGQPVSLTPKMFEALLLLVQSGGSLVEKEALLAHLWPNTSVEENNLSQCIYMLRKVLGEKGSEGDRYIETVPKRGYRFLPAVRIIARENGHAAPVAAAVSHTEGEPQPEHHEEPGFSPVPVMTPEQVRPRRKSRVWIAAAGLAIIISGFVVIRWLSRRTYAQSRIPTSLAVLPFDSLGSTPKDDYLGLGLADALITELSQAGSVHVRPIDDIWKYSASRVNPLKAGRELGVGALLHGTVQRDGDNVRVNMELLNVNTGATLWADQMDCRFVDIFGVEDRVAAEVESRLIPELNPSRPASWRPTVDPAAYEDYMKGRFFWSKRTAEGLTTAIQYFQQAIDRDPQYAQAYAGLADAYALLGFYAYLPPMDSYPKAEQAAMHAISIDDSLAEAHASLLNIKTDYDWDWAGAEKEFQRAVALNPNYAAAYQWHAYVLLAEGRADAAIADMERAMELDPVSPGVNSSSAWALYLKRDYQRCAQQCDRTLALYPDFVVAHQVLALAYTEQKKFDEADAELARAQQLDPSNPITPPLLARLDAVSGKPMQAEEAMQSVMGGKVTYKTPAYYIAAVYAALGRDDEAFRWLDRAYADHSNWLIYLKLDPRFDPLRNDPRFAALLRKMGLS